MIELVVIIRVIAHLVTFVALAFWYKDPDAQWRPGVSITATVVAGSSFASAFLLWYSSPPILTASMLFETVLVVAFTVLIVMARGNMARLFPRRVWSHR